MFAPWSRLPLCTLRFTKLISKQRKGGRRASVVIDSPRCSLQLYDAVVNPVEPFCPRRPKTRAKRVLVLDHRFIYMEMRREKFPKNGL